MFTGLENHSVLYVLHQSTRVASLNQQEVLEILQKSPLQNVKGKRFCLLYIFHLYIMYSINEHCLNCYSHNHIHKSSKEGQSWS